MRRKRPIEVECEPKLVTFEADQWPAQSPIHSWLKWLGARADFADAHDLDHDVVPYNVDAAQWAEVLRSIAAPHVSTGQVGTR
ncbi:hypothetical protein BJ986_000204 [Phycicoccus badiiscoriae]|uniref:Uncharacterized protein n=1 Tax=Pedococcus badiiscoriae TaxID=642776 RepID=A0A852W929_9MICO|nr:hypothetical protein [Pedococcus badiiscoriae]